MEALSTSHQNQGTSHKVTTVNPSPTTLKYTCVGAAQVLNFAETMSTSTCKASSCAGNSNTKKQRTQTFVVKKVGKDFKMQNANINYKIKPVFGNGLIKATYPKIYMGSPQLTHPDDFLLRNSTFTTPSYESPLQNSLLSEVHASIGDPVIATTTPSMIANNHVFTNISDEIKKDDSTNMLDDQRSEIFKLDNVFQMVARTVPSATISNSAPNFKVNLCADTNTVSQVSIKESCSVVSNTSSILFPSVAVVNQDTHQTLKTSIVPGIARPIMSVKIPNQSNDKSVKINGFPLIKVRVVPKLTMINAIKTSSGKKQGKKQAKSDILPNNSQTKIHDDVTTCTVPSISSQTNTIQHSETHSTSHEILSGKVCTQSIHQSKTNKLKQDLKVPPPSSPIKKIVHKHLSQCAANKLSSTNTELSSHDKDNLKRKFDEGYAEQDEVSKQRLRLGVEIQFDDGVKHFVSNLKHITYLDDEPIKAWGNLKKGTDVAALWKDGMYYDATVVACYFPKDLHVQPAVKLKKPKSSQTQSSTKVAKSIQSNNLHQKTKIMCSSCKTVFTKITEFRKHQKKHCKSPGISVLTDKNVEKIEVSPNDLDCKIKSEKELEKNREKNVQDIKEVENHEASETKTQNLENSIVPPTSTNGEYLFCRGTKFLHRWQLEDKTSKWYHGEVMQVLSRTSDPECEFEVLYKGEEGSYIVKLYEDYPSDIRIMG